MITLKDFMELVDYKVTEGSEYCWDCFGSDAYSLSYWNQDHNGHSICIIFDTRTHEVYAVESCDYKHERAYRLINPDYKDAHDNEANGREVDIDQAWDDVDYVDLDVDDDFIQKALAIVNDEDYDIRVSVPVDFTDEELLTYMKIAHERDITFNQLVEDALRAAIEEHKMRDEYDFSDAECGPVEESIKTIKKKKKKKDKK
jgi:hypothetical protein